MPKSAEPRRPEQVTTRPAAAARATIRDVSRESGVALSTVSNALSGKGYVRDETRRLIQDVAQRLGYRASAVAQAMRTRRTQTIGVLLADIANPSSPDFVRGIEDVAERKNCTLLLCNNDGNEGKQIRQLRNLLDRNVDGIVLISQFSDTPEVRPLLSSSVPFVLVQRRSMSFNDDYIGADNDRSIEDLVTYLASLGHTRIGYVRGPAASSAVLERLAAYRRTIARLGLDASDDLVYAGDYGTAAGYEAAMVLLRLSVPPTAIIASNDMNALGVLDAAAELGLDVPGALSVAGYDDIALARLARIDLTTIRLPKRQMGAAAAELLLERIRLPGLGEPRSTIFQTELVVRGSTGPARMNARRPARVRAQQKER